MNAIKDKNNEWPSVINKINFEKGRVYNPENGAP